MGERHKKIVIRTLVSCYAFSIVFHDRLMFGVQAEDTITNTNIVAVFVDSNIYEDIKPDLQRYTTQYIQDKLSRTKAVVMPIDASTFKARDIAKILDNMYFDGIKDKTANLVGTILIGNLPLPVVQYENYYFQASIHTSTSKSRSMSLMRTTNSSPTTITTTLSPISDMV
jgi:sugar-specific transcriptional regulator TrmB